MFVAWRDLMMAKGRFALVGAVVGLITVLVTFLSGLTAGLAEQSISAITSLPADRVVFSAPQGGTPSYADSAMTRRQATTWERQPGVTSVEPLGISVSRLSADDRQATATLFGGRSVAGAGLQPGPGRIAISPTTAEELGLEVGDHLEVSGERMAVDIAPQNSYYSHTPVAHLNLADWQKVATRPGEATPFATVLTVTGQTAALAAADRAANTSSTTVLGSLTALESFKSEVGSLLLMVAMLFFISALVVGSFFTVWSIQRRPDVAVLKALGATNRMLTVDALGQAAVLLLLGGAVGVGTTALLGTLAGTALPFVLNPLTTLVPTLILTLLGLAGPGLATRSITHIDPLTALGSNR